MQLARGALVTKMNKVSSMQIATRKALIKI